MKYCRDLKLTKNTTNVAIYLKLINITVLQIKISDIIFYFIKKRNADRCSYYYKYVNH